MSSARTVPPNLGRTDPRALRPPVALAAAALSLLAPGAGHLYAGRPVAGAAVGVGFLIAAASVPFGLMAAPNALVFAAVLVGFGAVYIVIAAHSWTIARAACAAVRPVRRIGAIPLLVFLAGMAASGAAVTRWVGRHVASAYRVESASMEPGVLAGDWLLARLCRGAPERDRVVIYRQAGESYVKRAIGIPGDTLHMRERRVFRNGRPIPEPYASYDRSTIAAAAATWGPVVVPRGEVFVLGDNRNHARDSRHFGFVDADSVVAYPARVYFSRDARTGAIRWRRIGRGFR